MPPLDYEAPPPKGKRSGPYSVGALLKSPAWVILVSSVVGGCSPTSDTGAPTFRHTFLIAHFADGGSAFVDNGRVVSESHPTTAPVNAVRTTVRAGRTAAPQ